MKKLFGLLVLVTMLTACQNAGFESVNYSAPPQPGLLCSLYQLPVGLDRTPDLSDLLASNMFVYTGSYNQAVGTLYTDSLNVIPVSLRPAYQTDFAMRCVGKLNVSQSGTYSLYLTSDDGSELHIDGYPTILNDFNSYSTSGSANVHLTSGQHSVTILYRQGPANNIALQLEWLAPCGTREIIPADVFTR